MHEIFPGKNSIYIFETLCNANETPCNGNETLCNKNETLEIE